MASGTATHYLLYPFVVIGQGLRRIGRQLRLGHDYDSKPQLTASPEVTLTHVPGYSPSHISDLATSTDLAIQNILVIAREEVGRSCGQVMAARVRGIATELPSRELVLVGTDNQVMKLLSGRQQKLLGGYVRMELAGQPDRPALAARSSAKAQTLLQEIFIASDRHIAAPIVKTTTIIAQVAEDVRQSIQHAQSNTAEKRLLPGQVPSWQVAWKANFNQAKSFILSASGRFLNQHLYPPDNPVSNSFQGSGNQDSTNISASPLSISPHCQTELPTETFLKPPVRPLVNPFDSVPSPEISAHFPNSSTSSLREPRLHSLDSEGTQASPQTQPRLANGAQSATTAGIQANQSFGPKIAAPLLATAADIGIILEAPPGIHLAAHSDKRPDNSSAATEADWLEVQVASSGYEKHILERVLSLLDRFMLWVEETVLKVWRWLTSRWARN